MYISPTTVRSTDWNIKNLGIPIAKCLCVDTDNEYAEIVMTDSQGRILKLEEPATYQLHTYQLYYKDILWQDA